MARSIIYCQRYWEGAANDLLVWNDIIIFGKGVCPIEYYIETEFEAQFKKFNFLIALFFKEQM